MDDEKKTTQHVTEILSDLIDDPKDPMRSALDRDSLFQLADDIKKNGLINPLTVRPVAERYEVVAGHRRFSALKIAGIIKIPCVVRELTDEQVFGIKMAENIERVDVDAVDEGRMLAAHQLITGKSVAEIAKQINRSPAYVESRLAVGNMDEYMQAGLREGSIKLGVALTLSEITDANLRRVWVEMAIRDGISVAQAEHWVRGWKLNQLPGGLYDPNPPADFVPGTPQVVKFKCALSGIEDDCRLYKSLVIHESKMDDFNAIAAEFQKEDPPAAVS